MFDKQTQSIAESMDDENFKIGQRYMIRTVTYHHIGTLTAIKESFGQVFLHLKDCFFITDSGPLDAMFKGKAKIQEAEKENDIKINISTITDFSEADNVITS